MEFKDTTLTFEDDKIVIDDGRSVMMSWEIPIMEKSAEYICESKGDILEIGFGMGICADFIQAHGVNSHTIIDIHPQVIEKLKVWAKDKDNVIIVEGDWYGAKLEQTYDGIFIDTYADDNWDKFKEFALSKANSGAKVTYYNCGWKQNEHGFDNISYDYLQTTEDVYQMPRVII